MSTRAPSDTTTRSGEAPSGPELIKAVPVRHPGRWVAAVIILLILALVAQSLVTNSNFRWDIVRTYILDVLVIQGIGWTLLLTVLSMVLAIVLAILLAFMRQSENPLFRYVSWVWVWFFRGRPVHATGVLGPDPVLYPKISVGCRSVRNVRLQHPGPDQRPSLRQCWAWA